MQKNTPLIKKFKTESKYYVYDTWTNEILNVHKNFWDYLQEAENGHINQNSLKKVSNLAEVKMEVEKAQKQGYLSTERPEVATYYKPGNWKDEITIEINYNLNELLLNVTEKCNFRCSYCTYSDSYYHTRNHSSREMSWEIARKSIEYAINHSENREKDGQPLAIGFYGGEPLCNFKLIKQSVLYCKKKYSHRNILFLMTTNGSLINEEIANFLIDNKFSIIFSIDGPQDLHDRYRKTIKGKPTYLYAIRGYDLIKKLDINKKCDISINSVMPPPFKLSEMEKFVNNVDDQIKIAMPANFKTTFYNQFDMTAEYQVYVEQSNQYFEKYAKDLINGNYKNRNKLAINLFERDLIMIAKRNMNRMNKKTASHGQCIIGSRRLFVSCDGKFYPCERVGEEYIIGNIKKGINFDYLYSLIEKLSMLYNRFCNNCWAIRLCYKCIANIDISEATLFNEFCNRKKVSIEQDLIRYCSILEQNSKALEFMKNYVLS